MRAPACASKIAACLGSLTPHAQHTCHIAPHRRRATGPHARAGRWEVVECARKALLVGAFIGVEPGTTTQLALAVMTTLFFTVAYGNYKPYQQPRNNVLQQVSQLAIFVSLLLALIVSAHVEAEAEDVISAALADSAAANASLLERTLDGALERAADSLRFTSFDSLVGTLLIVATLIPPALALTMAVEELYPELSRRLYHRLTRRRSARRPGTSGARLRSVGRLAVRRPNKSKA